MACSKQAGNGSNRDIQRRSRARRREYLSHLEERLRQYERDGIQASLELQSEARTLDKENKFLRHWLMQATGTTAEEIDACLHISATGEQPSLRMRSDPRGYDRVEPGVVATNSDHPGLSRPHPEPRQCEDGQCKVASRLAQVPDNLDICKSHALSSEPISAGLTFAAAKSTDETFCEEAAHIIASMRRIDNPQDVWDELGCSKTSRCSVKNTTLFHLMDR